MGRLEIRTGDGVAISHGGERVALRSRRATALLVYLACVAEARPRTALARLLWGELSEARALGNLRVVLDQLRRQVGEHLIITRQTVGFRPESDHSLELPVGLAGGFLAGLELPDAPGFGAWVAEQRQKLAGRLIARGQLPTWPTRFIGREAELARLGELLADPTCRLMTLVGLGGAGKTRLAVEIARAARLRDGSVFVPLAPTTQAALIVPTLADALGLPASLDDPRGQLVDHLRDKAMLVVLDNFEQVVDGGAELVADLIEAAPELKVMVTSRVPLALRGEWRVTLGGLPREQAAELFRVAARPVQRQGELSEETEPSIDRICELVEGVPLAIEMAAGWTSLYSPETIVREIARSVDFLTTRLRDVPERHRSLRAVFEHSWSVLAEGPRRVFRALSIFRGGATADALHEVAESSIVDLQVLVERSLVRTAASDRYEVHELLRQYAESELAQEPEHEQTLRARHCRYFAGLLGRHDEALHGAGQATALRSLEGEIDNIRIAWEWAVMQGAADPLGQMLDPLGLFYDLRGWIAEGERTFGAAVDTGAAGADDLLQARLTTWRGRFLHLLARYDESSNQLEDALIVLRREGGRRQQAFCLLNLGNHAAVPGEYERGRELYAAGLALYRDAGDGYGAGNALNLLGGNAFDTGDYPEARRRWQEAVAQRRAIGDLNGAAHALQNLGEVALVLGDFQEAEARLQQALSLMHELGDRLRSIQPVLNLGAVAHARGQFPEARRLLGDALSHANEVGDRKAVAFCQLLLAQVLAASGEVGEAERLYLGSLALNRRIGYQRMVVYCLAGLARFRVAQGDPHEARAYADEALIIARTIGDRRALARSLIGSAEALAALAETDLARKRLGEAVASLNDTAAAPELIDALVVAVPWLLAEGHPRADEIVRMALTHPAAWAATRERARTLSGKGRGRASTGHLGEPLLPGDLGGLAASLIRPEWVASGPAASDALTAREREVADLIARGLSNREIADRLVISHETARVHVKRILAKLGCASRAQVAVWVVTQGREDMTRPK